MYYRPKEEIKPFYPDLKPEKAEKKKRARIKPMSENRKFESKVYAVKGKEFLIGKICPVTGEKATGIHHKSGRKGFADQWARDNNVSLFLDERFWLAVSDDGHKFIEANPEIAYKNKWSIKRIEVRK